MVHNRGYEAGFIDNLILLFVGAAILIMLIPFAWNVTKVIIEKQALNQAAYSMARAWSVSGARPPRIANVPTVGRVAVASYGSAAGCTAIEVIVSAVDPINLSSFLLGGSETIRTTGSASLPQDAYRLPDAGGINCDNAQAR